MSTERGKKLLVVEDNEIVREGLALSLRQQGYQVALARNGLEALAYLGSGAMPDLILLDMLMPVLDGWHFLEQLRHKVPHAVIPIIVATAVAVISQEWAQAHGCAGCLRKPIEPGELLAEIRRCLTGDDAAAGQPGALQGQSAQGQRTEAAL